MWNSIFILNVIFVGCIVGQQVSELKTPKINIPIWPIWDENTQSVYFVDYLVGGQAPAIYRYNFDDGNLYSASVPGTQSISFIYRTRKSCRECDDIFGIGNEHGVSLIKWNGKSQEAQLIGPRKLLNVEETDPKSHMNVAQADRKGRLFFGTFSLDFCNTPANKSFYRYTTDRGIDRIVFGLYGTSGIAINEDAKKIYHLDYCSLSITEFDYDPKTGDLSNGRIAFDFNSIAQWSELMMPLGLAIDSNGNLYTANYRNLVYVIDPRLSKVVKVIDIGVSGVSGVVFGGPKHDILFVLASRVIINTMTGRPMEMITTGTALYKVTGLCVTGLAPTRFKIPKLCQKQSC